MDRRKFNEYFIKNCNEESDGGYFLEVELHNDLPFLPERKKLKKVEKLFANLLDNNECVIHIRNLKQVLNHGLILKKS